MWNLIPGATWKVWGDIAPPNDVEFIRTLVERLVEEGLADAKQIYIGGFSNGAIMTYRVLCEAPNLFAAGAPISGGPRASTLDACNLKDLPPVITIMGTDDPILNYNGETDRHGRELGILELMSIWQSAFKCDAPTKRSLEPDELSVTGPISILTLNDCQGGKEFLHYQIGRGGHRVAMKKTGPERWNKRFGLQNTDIDSAVEVWNFFKRFSK